MVADEVSLVESAGCLCNDVVVIDLALVRGDAVELVRRVRGCVPDARIVVLSADGQSSVVQSVADAGADAFIVKPAIAGDLLVAIDAVLSGRKYVSRTANIR